MNTMECIGKTAEDAIQTGVAQMGVSRDEVDIDILDEGAKGVFGLFGTKMARVRLTKKYSVAGHATAFLSKISELMGIAEPEFVLSNDEQTLKIQMSGEQATALIGHRGETLDALQLLCGLAVNQRHEENHENYHRIWLDICSYREKREATLTSLAHRMAEKVRQTGHNVSLEPMNSYERRIIHATLSELDDVVTFSLGEEPNRRVVISRR